MVALGCVIGHRPRWVIRTWVGAGSPAACRRTGRPRVAPTAARSWSSWASGQLPPSCKRHPGWRPGHVQLCCRRRSGRKSRTMRRRSAREATYEDLRRSGGSQEPCLTVGVPHAGRELTRDGAGPSGVGLGRIPRDTSPPPAQLLVTLARTARHSDRTVIEGRSDGARHQPASPTGGEWRRHHGFLVAHDAKAPVRPSCREITRRG